jgi:hypothetical protein
MKFHRKWFYIIDGVRIFRADFHRVPQVGKNTMVASDLWTSSFKTRGWIGKLRSRKTFQDLDLSSEHGSVNQDGRDSYSIQYVAAVACKEPRQLFQNGTTVAGALCWGNSIGDSFFACQIAFSSKNSSESCHRVHCECHDIPRCQSLMPVI